MTSWIENHVQVCTINGHQPDVNDFFICFPKQKSLTTSSLLTPRTCDGYGQKPLIEIVSWCNNARKIVQNIGFITTTIGTTSPIHAAMPVLLPIAGTAVFTLVKVQPCVACNNRTYNLGEVLTRSPHQLYNAGEIRTPNPVCIIGAASDQQDAKPSVSPDSNKFIKFIVNHKSFFIGVACFGGGVLTHKIYLGIQARWKENTPGGLEESGSLQPATPTTPAVAVPVTSSSVSIEADIGNRVLREGPAYADRLQEGINLCDDSNNVGMAASAAEAVTVMKDVRHWLLELVTSWY